MRQYTNEKTAKLQALTDKFLEEFMELSCELDNKDRTERTDSYDFNYNVADCLVNSKYAYSDLSNMYNPLMQSGFAQNIIKGLFINNLQEFPADISHLIENFDNQDTNRNSTTSDLHILKSDKGEKISFNISSSSSSFEGTVFVTKKERKVFFNENEYNLVMCTEQIEFYTKRTLVFSINVKYDGWIEPKIEHFKYVADINSFYSVLNTIQFV